MINTETVINFKLSNERLKYEISNTESQSRFELTQRVTKNPGVLTAVEKITRSFHSQFSLSGSFQQLTAANMIEVLNTFLTFKIAQYEHNLQQEAQKEELDANILLKTPFAPQALVDLESILISLNFSQNEIDEMSISKMVGLIQNSSNKNATTKLSRIMETNTIEQLQKLKEDYKMEKAEIPSQVKQEMLDKKAKASTALKKTYDTFRSVMDKTNLSILVPQSR